MVMETPTPQCVGREFVRQYYTMLHEGPQFLHRFYSQNSSFVHGGVEKPGEEQPPVMGQNEIHKKVMSLNFLDCHAKIRQVDSQATVGSAVVVQVTGELSNNGQPMRRFMQTFVLAPQSPKKYYVHNDIFRYQDEVFHDTDSEEEEKEEEQIDSETDILETGSQPDEIPDYEAVPGAIMSNGTSHIVDGPVTPVIVDDLPIVTEDTTPIIPDNEPADPEPEPEPVAPTTMEEETPVKEDEELEPEPLADPEEVPTKPFSWAALASKTPSGGQPAAPVSQNKPVSTNKPVNDMKEDNRNDPQPQRLNRSMRERTGAVRDRGSQGGSIGRGEGDNDEMRKPPQQRWPDQHHLFVGNLPIDTKVFELRNYFEVYGKIVDIRIITKGTDKKNYGFVIFEDPSVVTTILKIKNEKDLKKFRKDHPPPNVEEKKAPTADRGGLRPGPRPNYRGGGMMGRGGSRGGMRGGMSSNMGGGPRDRMDGPRGPGRGGGPGGFNGPRR